MAKVFIKATRPLNKIEQVIAHAKYVGFRSKEVNEKGFFGRDSDRVDYNEFVERIKNNPALKHSRSIKAHKLFFSLKEVDYNAYLRSGKDYKDLIRKTLAVYEDKHGVKLDWIANIHAKEGHPHCHVIIKGVSDSKDKNGRYKRIKFVVDDFREMKSNFDKEFYKDVQYTKDELQKTLLTNKEQNKIMNDISKGFEQVTRGIANDIEREQKLAEMEKVRDAKKASREASRDEGRDMDR